jgi:hypothetical protein
MLATMALVAVGCPARTQGPELPDVADEQSRIERRVERTEQIGVVMRRDLERIESLSGQLSTVPRELFAGAFPLDLFKHVAVDCLNASAAEGADPQTGADESPVSPVPAEKRQKPSLACQPRFYDRLVTRLEVEAPGRKTRALDLLQQIDEFHTLRLRLRIRLGKLEDIMADNRDFLAKRRADLRKQQEKWSERRPEFSAARWRALQQRFDRLSNELNRLEHATNQIAETSSDWPASIDAANRTMYFAITAEWEPPY